MNKKIFVILIVLICTLFMSTVSATDTEDSSAADVAAVNGPGSFTELQSDIDNARMSLELTRNYTYSEEDKIDTITISSYLEIDGKGHTIDASNKASVFTIDDGMGVYVIIKNITFINGNSISGGVINNNGQLVIEDCYFMNNNATIGGAINNNGNLDLHNCYFMNNNATIGGAINNNNLIVIYDPCNFMNNNATMGGAIYNNESIIVNSGCDFINNTAANMGGAIYNNGNLNVISGCDFINNTAANMGGAIYNNDKLTVKNSNFTNNAAPIGSDIVVGIDKIITLENSTAKITFITSMKLNNVSNVTATENATISGTVSSKANGTVTITVNGADVIVENVKVENGAFTTLIPKLPVGTYNATVVFKGENYTDCNATTNNFTVNKATATIVINPIARIDVGDNIVVSGNTTGIANNTKITITINGKGYNATVVDDKFSQEIKNITSEGTVKIVVSYAGNDNVTGAEDTINVTVGKYPSNITFDNITAIVGENVTVSGTTVPSVANITITANGKTFNVAVKDGTFSLNIGNFTKTGNQTITAKYDGNEDYSNYTVSEVFTVEEKETIPTVTTIVDITDVLNAGDKLLINATVTSENKPINGTVELLINGESITKKEAVNGKVSFNVTPYAGKLTVMVKFVGDDNYGESNATHDITVKGIEATLTVPDVTLFFSNGTQLMIYLTSNGANVSDEKVTININGVDYTRTVKNGTAKFAINLAPGTYTVTVSLESYKYNYVSTNATVTVLPVIKGNDTVLYFKNGTKYVALFLDGQGKPLVGAKVQFNINGVFYDRTTDKNGNAGLTINLAPDTYKITVTNTVNGAVHANNITILPVIEGNDTVLFFKNGTKYVALFLDGQGKPLVGAKVQFNINGVFYDRTTNEKGTASITINLAPDTYVITAINLGNGALHANNITVLPTIIGENVVKYYKNETQYVVKVVDGKGNALANQTVNYNINGVFYERITDANGTAVFKINLAAGNSEPQDYIITARCNDCIVSNTVTVLPVLTAKDFTEPFGAGKKFTANIVDGQGKPLAGAKIQFNINGVFYNRTSDVNGTVGLNINLAPGEYIITGICKDNGAVISNKVTVTPKV